VVDTISVAVRRGAVVEAVHHVHAVAVRDGEVVASAGDPSLVSFLRSSAKPFQALELVRSRDDLTDRDIAIASASHRAEPQQIEAVRALLARAGAKEDDLECGFQEGRPPGRIYHNCSGKHAGMLAACQARGWRTEGYRMPGHRMQRANGADVAAAADLDEERLPTATDGCGVVTWALPLERMAAMFSRLESTEEGRAVAGALRAHPELISGAGGTDTELMRTLAGFAAKGGAEGLLCACGPGGVGIALKVVDGSMRAMRPALAELLVRLGIETGELGVEPLENSLGDLVGEVVSESSRSG
jgi:L-asparaginase II